MTDSSKRERVRRTPTYRKAFIGDNVYESGGAIITPEHLNIIVYAFIPPFDSSPLTISIPKDQVEYPDGHFTKLYRRYESRNWNIQEIKPKEETHEKVEIHPQTGRPV